MGVKPSRDELLTLCDRGVVPVEMWINRDTAAAQIQLGTARALLAAGCEFHIITTGDMKSTDSTWWVEITWPGFGHFDWGGAYEDDTFYIPTAERLDVRDGMDWY